MLMFKILELKWADDGGEAPIVATQQRWEKLPSRQKLMQEDSGQQ